jgi:hypothetical protein
MTLTRIPLLCLVLATACSQAGANEGHKFLSSLNEKDRNARLSEMLTQVVAPCVVERNFFRGTDEKRAAFWAAGCTSGKAYTIMILDDAKGSTRILDCKVMMERAKVDCFKKM